MAETLGLPIGKNRIHFNKAVQGLVEIGCENPSPAQALCKVRTMNNQTFLDFTQTYDIRRTPEGGLNISVQLDGTRPWPANIQNSSFGQKKEAAIPSAFPAGSPLARTSQGPDGAMIIQNDVKEVRALNASAVSMTSSVPVSDKFAIDLTNVFSNAKHSVTTAAVPRAVFGNKVFAAVETQPASRPMDYTSSDPRILSDNLAIAAKGDGVFARRVGGP